MSKGFTPIEIMDKSITCLYLELPEIIADDVKKKWEEAKKHYETLIKNAFYYHDGAPRDAYLYNQFKGLHNL